MAEDEEQTEEETEETTEEEAEPASEFPSDWHRERYAEDLAREFAGQQRRVAELKANGVGKDDPAMRDAVAGAAAARAELERVAPKQETAEKRPRGRPRKTAA